MSYYSQSGFDPWNIYRIHETPATSISSFYYRSSPSVCWISINKDVQSKFNWLRKLCITEYIRSKADREEDEKKYIIDEVNVSFIRSLKSEQKSNWNRTETFFSAQKLSDPDFLSGFFRARSDSSFGEFGSSSRNLIMTLKRTFGWQQLLPETVTECYSSNLKNLVNWLALSASTTPPQHWARY